MEVEVGEKGLELSITEGGQVVKIKVIRHADIWNRSLRNVAREKE